MNDVGGSAKYAVDFPSFHRNLTETILVSVEELYRLGSRSYLFMNLAPLDRTPGNQVASEPSPNATQVGWYNAALAEHATLFSSRYQDAEAILFDAHARLGSMLDGSEKMGL